MKKHVKMYGVVLISLVTMVVLSGCAASSSSRDTQEAVADSTSAQQSNVTEQVQTPDNEKRAHKQLQIAEYYMASAKKGLIPYAQPVKICRDIIKNNPGTTYETSARELLKEVPEDQRSHYNLTDQELGL